FFSIGCTGPGAPFGGWAPESTFGWVIAKAGGQTHNAAARAAAKQPYRRRARAEIID
ncbi:MAG: hypothetical protein JOY55_03485, partial [Mycobacterium sp.]|nr:hypothetical protein [Mycobacterium sp.]